MAVSEHTTVKVLVDKHASMNSKMNEIFRALKQLRGRIELEDSEILDSALKDKRYAVQLLLQEYRRLEADLKDLEDAPVRFLRD